MKNIFKLLFVSTTSFFLCFLFYKDAYPTTLLSIHKPRDVYTSFSDKPLVNGGVIEGKFKANYDNLGSVSLFVRTFGRTNFDAIVFQLKEQGSANWFVENEYYTDRFPDGALYPFGFPVIKDSMGKVYEFRITSVNGTKDKAIGFIAGPRSFTSNYIYQKSNIIRDKELLTFFVYHKILSTLSDPWTLIYIAIFIMPILFFARRYTFQCRKNRQLSMILLIFMQLFYLVNPLSIDSNFILYIFGVMLWVAVKDKISVTYVFIEGLLLLVFVPILLFLEFNSVATKTSILIFFDLLLGSIMVFTETYLKQRIDLLRSGFSDIRKKTHS